MAGLPIQPAFANPQARPNEGAFSFMSAAAICFLTINTAISSVRSRDDLWNRYFVFSLYVLLLLSLWCLCLNDRQTPEMRKRLKMLSGWSAAIVNVAFFVSQLVEIIDGAKKRVLRAVDAFRIIAGFYPFFVFFIFFIGMVFFFRKINNRPGV